MSASEILDSAAKVLVPTYAPLPIVPASASGSTVTDTDGTTYVDLGAGIAVTALGHNPPVLHAALVAQADKLWHVSNIFANEPAIRLAEALVERTFADRVFFSNSGAEANEAALKLARRHAFNKGLTDKYEIIALHGAFHGRTLFTVSVGGTASYKEGFGPALEGIVHITPNSIDELIAAVSERTCAVMLEPIQGEGGVRPLDLEFLKAARAACDANDALLIFDEIQTGAGRTGTLYAYEQMGVVPDVLTSAKGLGGGIPIGATLVRGDAAEALGRGTHGTTFGGNPIACAVASALLDEVTSAELMTNVAERTEQLMTRLRSIASSTAIFGEVRGMGLLVGAEMSSAFTDRAKDVQVAALAAGAITLVAGTNVVRFAPALNITEAELDEGLDRLERAIKALI